PATRCSSSGATVTPTGASRRGRRCRRPTTSWIAGWPGASTSSSSRRSRRWSARSRVASRRFSRHLPDVAEEGARPLQARLLDGALAARRLHLALRRLHGLAVRLDLLLQRVDGPLLVGEHLRPLGALGVLDDADDLDLARRVLEDVARRLADGVQERL